MSEKEKAPVNNGHDIESLLEDFGRQKQEHESNFGELEPPVKRDEEQKSFSESNAPLVKAARAKKKEKVLIILCAVLGTAAVIAAVIGGVSFAKTAYLRPYQKQYPNVNFPEGIRKEYCEYFAGHTNLAGRISAPDCGFEDYVYAASKDYPVLDTHSGSRNLTFNTVVYINNADADFETAYSTAEAYLASTQKLEFSTLYEDYTFNVIGAFYTNSAAEDDAGYVFPYNLTACPVGSDFDNYTDRLYHRFLYNTDYEITRDDKLLTVALKSDFMTNFRFVVVGVLDGETQTTATPNEKVHYPQIWFTKYNLENPYRFAAQWYPTIPINNGEGTSQQTPADFTVF